MRIAIGSDHRGVSLKAHLVQILNQWDHEVVDVGTDSEESVDYPDIASAVGNQVSEQQVDRGILICGTGIGMCIVANKFDGVRAAPIHDDITAALSRQHNDLNVLCLSADLISDQALERIVTTWLKTEFEGGRHARRLEKVAKIETDKHDEPIAQEDPVS